VHTFWPDNISLLDSARVDPSCIHGLRQLADAYLLALAVANNGCLVTFEQSSALGAVTGASASHLVVLDHSAHDPNPGASAMTTHTMLRIGRDVRTFLQYVMRDAPRASKVSREAFIAALEAVSDDDMKDATKDDQPSVAARSGRFSLGDFLAKLAGNGPATLDIGAKEVIEAAMNRAVADGRNVVTLHDLRAAAQTGD